jgi:Uma2 family endonuclease
MNIVSLQLPTSLGFTDETFIELIAANPDLRCEFSADHELMIMSPTGGETGDRNLELAGQIWFWNRQKKLGKAFDSSTGFKLPNGAIRSPDISWVKMEKWNGLKLEEKKKFPPLCPDFVIELRSPTDDLADVQAKMREYLDNGLLLGWLIDPQSQQVEIYQPNQQVEVLLSPIHLYGGKVLPGLVLDLQYIWSI